MNQILLSMTSALLSGILLLSCSSNGEPNGGAGDQAEKAESRASKNQKDRPFATNLIVKEKPKTLSKIDVEVMESSPQQFALNFALQTPTPGYEAKVGKLETKAGALLARIDLLPPDGPSLTVLDQAQVRIPLGELRAGSWILKVQVFQDKKPLSTLDFALEAKE